MQRATLTISASHLPQLEPAFGWAAPHPAAPTPCAPAAEEIADEIVALRVLRGDFGFAAAKGASPQQLLEQMIDQKERTGAFVGASSATLASQQPAASESTKEE